MCGGMATVKRNYLNPLSVAWQDLEGDESQGRVNIAGKSCIEARSQHKTGGPILHANTRKMRRKRRGPMSNIVIDVTLLNVVHSCAADSYSDLLDIAEKYYETKGSRPSTSPEVLKSTIDEFHYNALGVIEELKEPIYQHYRAAILTYRAQLQQFGAIMEALPQAYLNMFLRDAIERMVSLSNEYREQYRAITGHWAQERQNIASSLHCRRLIEDRVSILLKLYDALVQLQQNVKIAVSSNIIDDKVNTRGINNRNNRARAPLRMQRRQNSQVKTEGDDVQWESSWVHQDMDLLPNDELSAEER
eukprot:Clim_evm77s172 gene=Clim_evmTU77s172